MSKTITCVDIDGNKYEASVSDMQWRPCAYGIVVKDKKILLSKQFGDKFDLPGGGMDLGETPESAVIREVFEETGIKVKNPKLLGVENSFFQTAHAENLPYHCLMFYFLCEYVGGTLSIEGFDEWEKEYAEMAQWLPLDALDKITVASSVDYRKFVKKALKAE